MKNKPNAIMAVMWICLTSCAVLSATPVSLTLRLVPAKAMLYERVKASISIRNNSGQLLSFDSGQEGAARFDLDVEYGKNRFLESRAVASLLQGVRVMPGETRIVECDLTDIYAIHTVGRYRVTAVLDWNRQTYLSKAAVLDIEKGIELQRLSAGMPGDASVARNYVLAFLQRDNHEVLCLRIEDAGGGNIYGLFELGPMLRTRPPVLNIDSAGNVHVFFQAVGMAYIHSAFTPYGVHLFSTDTRLASEQGEIVQSNLPAAADSVGARQKPSGGMLGRYFNSSKGAD